MTEENNGPYDPEDEDASPERPRRQIGRRTEPAAEVGTSVATYDDEVRVIAEPEHDVDPREDSFAERQVAALFGLAIVATLGFMVAFFAISVHTNIGRNSNLALGSSMAVAMLALGGGFIVWAKKLLPHEKAVQDRHAFYSDPAEEAAAEDTFLAGASDLGLGKRKILRRTLMGALALVPLPFIVMLRDLGPLPGTSLNQTGWKAGLRLVDLTTREPVKLGDLEIGGIQTVMPQGFGNVNDLALAPTILIRFAPGEILSPKEANWGVDDHVAYSKICTHAGCPISLYEQQTHHLLCPCHQSTFDMARDAKVIFGPAARPLPQLQIGVDDEGYFYAKGPYSEPVGPSFWERR
jgi:ubiquinol-cytochrome c reductase iron-sulfur subunit